MAIHVALNHVTKYRYKKRVSLGPQIVRLRPAPHSRTPILSYSLKITPENHFINWQQDPQGNYLARLSFPEKTESFEVAVDLTANMSVINPFDFFLEETAEHFPFRYEPWLKKELEPFLEAHQPSSAFSEYIKQFTADKTPTIDYLVSMIRSLNQDIRYLVRMESGVQSPEETLTRRSGSCRDSAWLLVQMLRHKGLAARFVSGYLIQLKPDVKSLDGPSGTDKDFTDLHAWAEVYLPGAGWIGLDPTSGLLTGEGHIPLVATPEPFSAAPISGMVEPCEVDFSHDMQIVRFHEDPRVTKPYTDTQWNGILNLGKKVDADLIRDDVRLTIGGEPTFVSADNMEGAQWNTEALGEEKFKLSETLFKKLKARWTSGSLIYSGQGKWYPGEPLPRWVMACYWRKDGIPVWKNDALLADPTSKSAFTTADAKKFMDHLVAGLGLHETYIATGYEDIFYYLWREKRLPANLDPSDAKLKDVLESGRLASLFENKLGEPAGYALPLSNDGSVRSIEWKSCEWVFKTNHMYLVAGDSPMGLRMPLDSLLWSKEEDQIKTYENDPFSQTGKIRFHPDDLKTAPVSSVKSPKKTEVLKGKSAKEMIRTALCVEQRTGRIHIFLPPVSEIEEYLDLIARIEKTASELDMPVVIEGYAPPHDARVQNFKITPDPGVIEVNVAPVNNWDEMVEQTVSLYEEAHYSRLGTEKFMLDGKHSGTGGGNHVVLGGETPEQSPFLRRPDLLASVITYWQNHPSLSYLFSGVFIGPTS
ncbi:MAG: transglutaminase family protein, partial [Candidatus Omnitrophica bacterium]|nr:transglutaminase family protein [Candidatus Omnitrophota bacterium]